MERQGQKRNLRNEEKNEFSQLHYIPDRMIEQQNRFAHTFSKSSHDGNQIIQENLLLLSDVIRNFRKRECYKETFVDDEKGIVKTWCMLDRVHKDMGRLEEKILKPNLNKDDEDNSPTKRMRIRSPYPTIVDLSNDMGESHCEDDNSTGWLTAFDKQYIDK